jgi:hypothetical protein
MSTVVSDMQTMITAQSKMMDDFMKQQSEQFKQQQAITAQQISSLINLVSRMIPTNQSPPISIPSDSLITQVPTTTTKRNSKQ